jgi:hypothetical protein
MAKIYKYLGRHASQARHARGTKEMSWRSRAGPLAATLVLLWLFTGVERSAREHGEVEYHPFLKHAAALQFVFENTAQCGECDLRPWTLMSREERDQFAIYCAARHGIGDVDKCYAMLQQKQRPAGVAAHP